MPWIQGYYLNLYPAHAMRPRLYQAMFQNYSVNCLQAHATSYAQYLLTAHLDPYLLQQLRDHQMQGDDVVLVSASVDLYLKPICEILDIELICTEIEIHAQHLTGRYQTPDCSGEQKRIRILERFNLNHYSSIYAYGNSHEDRDMLALADYPYMVGTDQQLPPLIPTHIS